MYAIASEVSVALSCKYFSLSEDLRLDAEHHKARSLVKNEICAKRNNNNNNLVNELLDFMGKRLREIEKIPALLIPQSPKNLT